MPEDATRLLGITAAARALGIHPNTLRAWVDKGLVPSVRLPSGYRRFTPEQILEIRQKMGLEGNAAA